VTTTIPCIRDRIVALDWAAMTSDLDNFGCTIVKSVLTREECRSIAAMYERDDIFRAAPKSVRSFVCGPENRFRYALLTLSVPLRSRRDAPSLLLSGFSMELEARIWVAAPVVGGSFF
jgi:hypothetical protein